MFKKTLFAILLMSGLFGSNAALATWDFCDVLQLGASTAGNQVFLSCDNVQTDAWYTVEPSYGNEGLATLLKGTSSLRSKWWYIPIHYFYFNACSFELIEN